MFSPETTLNCNPNIKTSSDFVIFLNSVLKRINSKFNPAYLLNSFENHKNYKVNVKKGAKGKANEDSFSLHEFLRPFGLDIDIQYITFNRKKYYLKKKLHIF